MQVDVVALDGTKLRANASKDANRLIAELEVEVASWLANADDVDAAEEREQPTAKQALARSERRSRIREALQQAREGRTGNGPVRRNVTDPDSRLMKARQGFVQGYNGQAMATATQVVIAAELTANPIDRNELVPMVQAAALALDAAGITEDLGVVLADAGYWSEHNGTAELGCELLIATTTADKQVHQPVDDVAARIAADDQARAADQAELNRRINVLERHANHAITIGEAADELGVSVGRTYALARRYRQMGASGLVSRRQRPNGQRRPDRVRPPTRVKHAMNQKLASNRGRVLYARRKAIVEPVFAHHKNTRRLDRFVCRGLRACATEWKLINTSHNLLKLWRLD